MLSVETIKNNEEIRTYIEYSDKHLAEMGYTEHGFRHTSIVSRVASKILRDLGCSEREAELAEIAGIIHDIGNVVNRYDHGLTGAVIAMRLLKELSMDSREIALIAAAIGNHEEQYGQAVNKIAAALIIADKSDVHRGRVRNKEIATFDIHDRVNYAAEKSEVTADKESKIIQLEVKINTEIVPVMDYFEIFLTRMVMCRKAAAFLDCQFKLVINDVRLL